MGKKAVVFGGSGFLGSHVADALTDAGHDVTIYDIRPSRYIGKTQKMITGDIMDEKAVQKAVNGCEYVFNFAGIADIDEASQRPLESVKYNVLGNSILLDAARKAKVKRFVFASSIYVYSKAGAFYRSTKQACELLIENYNEIFNLPYTILRYGSLYGTRADGRNYIYQIVRQALTEGRIARDGDGEEIREYINVCDAAKGSVEILADEFANECVVIAGEQRLKVKDLLVMIKEMLDNKIKIEYLPSKASNHYEITPYTFAPRVAKRIVSRTYHDLGQGILNCIQEIYREINPAPVCSGAPAKKRKSATARKCRD
jgi:UDP-glucose 4-epimerase